MIFIFFNFIFSLILFYCLVLKFPIKLFYKQPDQRGFHYTPISQIGGLLIFIVIFINFFFISIINSELNLNFLFLLIIFPLFCICIIDDIREINISIRIIFQLLTISVLLLFYNGHLLIDNIYYLTITLFIIIYLVSFLNFFNFMDGINGYVSSNFLFIIIFYSYLFNPLNYLDNYLLITIIPIIVFLYFNFILKKVFLGDSGSILLAFILIVFYLDMYEKSFLNIYQIILINSLYFIDAISTFLIKLIKKENIFHPHKTHIYQLLNAKYNYYLVNFFQLLNNIVILAINYLLIKFTNLNFLIVIIFFLFVMFVIVYKYKKLILVDSKI